MKWSRGNKWHLMSKVEPLKAGLTASGAVDNVYGMEKCLCVQCLSFTTGARFWYMSSTASIDTWGGDECKVESMWPVEKSSERSFIKSSGNWSRKRRFSSFECCAMNTWMFLSISWFVSKSSSSSPNGLMISSPTCAAEVFSETNRRISNPWRSSHLEPAGVEEELQQCENGDVDVYSVILVAFVRVQELAANHTKAKKRVDRYGDDLRETHVQALAGNMKSDALCGWWLEMNTPEYQEHDLAISTQCLLSSSCFDPRYLSLCLQLTSLHFNPISLSDSNKSSETSLARSVHENTVLHCVVCKPRTIPHLSVNQGDANPVIVEQEAALGSVVIELLQWDRHVVAT